MQEYPGDELANDIEECISPEEFERIAQGTFRAFDQITAQTPAKLECRAGCSLCCSLRVDIFAHEALLIARHIRQHFTAEEVSGLLLRLEKHAAQVLPLTPFEHATRNLQCALLLPDGRCSVYAVRPQSCRRHHSLDFAACQFTFDHPSDLEAPAAHDRDLYKEFTAAMQENIDAYSASGFDCTIYELGTAVNEALQDPSSWDRWRRGETAFVHASVTPAG